MRRWDRDEGKGVYNATPAYKSPSMGVPAPLGSFTDFAFLELQVPSPGQTLPHWLPVHDLRVIRYIDYALLQYVSPSKMRLTLT